MALGVLQPTVTAGSELELRNPEPTTRATLEERASIVERYATICGYVNANPSKLLLFHEGECSKEI